MDKCKIKDSQGDLSSPKKVTFDFSVSFSSSDNSIGFEVAAATNTPPKEDKVISTSRT